MLSTEYNALWMWNMNDTRSIETAARSDRNMVFTEDDENLLDEEGDE